MNVNHLKRHICDALEKVILTIRAVGKSQRSIWSAGWTGAGAAAAAVVNDVKLYNYKYIRNY